MRSSRFDAALRILGPPLAAAAAAPVVYRNRVQIMLWLGALLVALFLGLALLAVLARGQGRAIPRERGLWFVLFAAIAASVAAFPDHRGAARCLVQWLLLWLVAALAGHARRFAMEWRSLLLLGTSVTFSLALLSWTGPFLLRSWLLPHYTLGLDHRPRPFNEGANEDGVYSPRVPADFQAAGHNIVFLGDSFTANVALPHEQRFPTLVEALLRERFRTDAIRTVNFGWVSSSPLLEARQLRAIGAKYRPHVVAQCLDLTDFHDDLKVAKQLRDRDLEPGREVTIFRLLRARLSFTLGVRDLPEWLRDQWAWAAPQAAGELPRDRWFHLRRPWQESAQQLSVTWRALLETRDVARSLGARYVLFAFPRYQQYNSKESPRDWEKARFPPAGSEFLLEPFRFLEERRGSADFPLHNLLADFVAAEEAPLCFDYDAHWNAAGNRVAARAIVRDLIADGLAEPAQPR